jgi:hypothetical protein
MHAQWAVAKLLLFIATVVPHVYVRTLIKERERDGERSGKVGVVRTRTPMLPRYSDF